jgi:hypothetical protein
MVCFVCAATSAEQRQFDTRTFTRPKKRLLPLSVAKSSNSDLSNLRIPSQENLLSETSYSRQVCSQSCVFCSLLQFFDERFFTVERKQSAQVQLGRYLPNEQGGRPTHPRQTVQRQTYSLWHPEESSRITVK